VLTAIADELRRDEAVARYRAQEQPKAENPGVPEEAQRAQAGPPPVSDPQLAAALGDADLPAPGSDPAASAPTVWSPVPRPVDLPAPASDPAASAPTVWSPVPRPVDLPAPAPADLPAPAADQADLRAPVADEADLQAPAADRADVPVPAADGADLQAPVADRADLSGPTADEPDEQPIAPLPRRIPGTNGAPPSPAHLRRNFLPFSLLGRRLDPDGHTEPLPRITRFGADSPAVPDSAYRTGDPAAPTLPAGTSPFVPTPPGSAPAGTGPWAPGVPGSFGAGPDAGPTERGSGPGAPGGEPSPPIASPGSVAPSVPAAPQGNGTVRPPVAPSAGGKQERSGRRYRIAGLLVAVIALIAAAVIVLLLSSGSGAAGSGHGGQGAPGTGAGERNLAAAWVAGQVSRTAMVACDPVMCRALAAHGVPGRALHLLGPSAISPLPSAIIVATAQVRAQFGYRLSSAYAPAVLASFGTGPQRIEVRQTALHGAAAYRARLGADLLSRKTSGAELLRSSRIAMAPIARRDLSAGRVDSRLLIAITGMASVHPMYIINFGSVAPGADPDLPLRFADLAESGRAHDHFARSPGYVRSMVSFLHAQRLPYRPAHVATVHLAGGATALRVEFPAPSPLGLLGAHRA